MGEGERREGESRFSLSYVTASHHMTKRERGTEEEETDYFPTHIDVSNVISKSISETIRQYTKVNIFPHLIPFIMHLLLQNSVQL